MSKKLICLASFILVLSLISNASADLVGYWPLNGDAIDVAGNHHGTLVGGASFVDDTSRGMVLSVDGVDDRVEIPHSDDLVFGPSDSFSVAAWLNIRTLPGNWAGVVTKSRDIEPWYGLWVTPDNQWHFVGGEGGANARMDVGAATTGWLHFAGVYNADAQTQTVYVDGVVLDENTSVTITASGAGDVWFGGAKSVSEFLDALIDDVRIYDHALTQEEIQIVMLSGAEGYPYSSSPDPEDGAVLTEFMSGMLGYSLMWKPGDFADSHDVYFGENFDDVNDGTGGTFRGNQTSTYFLAGYGYTPNDPAPTGFVPGTTYYWRIDEVNDTDPNSPWKGDVWSFSLPATKAYTPSPADGAKFIDPDADLSWEPGFGAVVQTVYFGDDYDTVNNAITDGIEVGIATYDPGPLELDKTYYWRVDTVGAFGPATGDVWSFRTLPDIPLTSDPNLIGWWKLDEDSGTTALDWSGRGHHGTLQGDPQWVDGYDGGGLECDGSGDYVNFGNTSDFPSGTSARSMCGWGKTDTVAAGWRWIAAYGSPVTSQAMFIGMNGPDLYGGGYGDDVFVNNFWEIGVWRHICLTYDGTMARLYADGIEVAFEAKNWDLVLSRTYIGRQVNDDDAAEFWNGLIDDVRIYNKVLTQEEIKQTMRGDPLLAWDPSPTNGSTPDIDTAVPLSWSPGDNASDHDVYFGTDKDAVEYADISDTTGIYRIRQSGTNYTPPEGVEWGGGPYYWRIDEYNTDGTISTGRIWSFTVADFISIDNIEGYDAENQIWYNWVDGLGFVKPDTPPNPGNGSGSEVGDGTTASFTEETITHGGSKSMPFKYNNNDPFKLKYSEAKLTLSNTRDWTEQDVKALSLWFQGYPGSVGSFTDNFNDTYTMTGSGFDIWGQSDEFHFAYKMLTGEGTITARVDSVSATHDWAKAGVMIRETLDPNSAHAFMCVTPASGVSFQRRPSTGADSTNEDAADLTAPYWVKLERDLAGNFTVTHSTDGSTWEAHGTLQTIPMNTNVYVGLAVTAHNDGNPVPLTCEAAFSNVTITGAVSGQWASQDIGIESNDAEPLYVAIANNTGQPAVVVHDDPNAAQIATWTEWNIDLRDFAGINLADVNSIAVGLGNRNNPQAGGTGKMYIDDIALYRPRCVPDKVTLSEADLNSDCVVDFRDLEIMTGNWLAVEPDPDVDLEADLNSDGTVDFKDYAVLADDWLDEQIWPEL